MSGLRRHPTPVLTRDDLPDVAGRYRDPSSVFNPGALALEGRTHLLLRVQSRARETFLVHAHSRDGVAFQVDDGVVEIEGLEGQAEKIFHVYDPRLTRLEGETYVVFAVDTEAGCRLGIARDLGGLRALELVAFDAEGDTRNGVLFPRKIGGRFARLERPNRTALNEGPTSGETIVLSTSDDLIRWESAGPVMSGRACYWDERIGSGPPPIETSAGWLHLYHGVATHFQSSNIYQAGVSLLDRDDPTRVLARSWQNILEPREPWELSGQVPNVVFPSGWVADRVDDEGRVPDDAELKVYYGAADTCVGMARTTVRELLEACEE